MCNWHTKIGCLNSKCTPHTKCPPGKYTKTAGSTTVQPQCEACETGFFKAFASNSSTKTDACTNAQNFTCPPGKYINITAIAEPRCETCAPGFFKDTASSAGTKNDSCTAHTKCPAGKYTSTSGNATAEPKCEVCAAGFFKDSTSRSSTCVWNASSAYSISVDGCASGNEAQALLFSALGSSSRFQNTWGGWYSAGSTVNSGEGKRVAYDVLPVSNLRFSDSTGRFVEYKLNKRYAGRTLLSIVQGCMGSNRQSTSSSAWGAGLCSDVGARTSSSGSFGWFSLSEVLRIGVGDEQNDGDDWALFMPLDGNADGDFSGSSVWVFGGEDQTNNGYDNTVTISATCGGVVLYSFNP